MQQLNENIIVLNPGDPLEEIYENYIKIYLSGTLDLNENKIPWQQKFINALVHLTSQKSENLPDLSEIKFLVINPLMPTDGPAVMDNPAFVQKLSWELQFQDQADIIFCNFLKKGKGLSSLTGLLLNAKSEKLVVRCPIDSIFYGMIKVLGQNYGFPVLADSSSALNIIKCMTETNPKLRDLLENGI